MTYLSGSPLYHYTLARELKKQGHKVEVFSMWSENELKKNLLADGIVTWYDHPKGSYDLVIISQKTYQSILDEVKAKKVINVVHSEYDCEDPITDKEIDEYVTIRPQIKKHIVENHKIPEGKVRVIYNGIDLEKFSPDKKKKHEGDYVKVVLPCTMDLLRKDFIEHYARIANDKYRVYIYGKNYNNDIKLSEYVYVHDEVPDIENYIADADLVAGILLGRVNLEARAMGIISFIHDPKKPADYQIYFPEWQDFIDKHDIKNVAKQICE